MFDQARCWIDGSIMPASEAKISVFDHGFLYGDGVFEGLRFYNGKAFRLPLHLKRLQRSAKAHWLASPGKPCWNWRKQAVFLPAKRC